MRTQMKFCIQFPARCLIICRLIPNHPCRSVDRPLCVPLRGDSHLAGLHPSFPGGLQPQSCSACAAGGTPGLCLSPPLCGMGTAFITQLESNEAWDLVFRWIEECLKLEYRNIFARLHFVLIHKSSWGLGGLDDILIIHGSSSLWGWQKAVNII